MIIKRIIGEKITESAKKYSVVFITGPRQSGKTTLVKQIFPKFNYQNLENPETRLIAQTDPKRFLYYSKKMIIDEIQRVPDLLSYIQEIIDEEKERKFILTGSQNILISQKISQTLAGRVNIFNLLPFSINEIKKTQFFKDNVYEHILKGFYPRIYNENLNPVEWYQAYTQTYLERDLREIKNIGNLLDFHRFLKLLAGRSGQILNLSSLASDVGVAVNTVKSWISVLSATYIIYLLPPFYKNFNKRIIKSPKIYFYDTGLLCSLLSIQNISQLKTHPLFGSIYETFCIGEFIKQNFHQNRHFDFYYFRDKQGNEVDLLYEDNGLNSVEIKSSMTINKDDFNNLEKFEKFVGKRINKRLVYLYQEKKFFKDVEILDWKRIDI